MKHWVYILKSQSNGSYYTGSTSDLSRRLRDHNRGKDKSVRGRGPYSLRWLESYPTQAAARARESQIKRYKGGVAFQRLIEEADARRACVLLRDG